MKRSQILLFIFLFLNSLFYASCQTNSPSKEAAQVKKSVAAGQDEDAALDKAAGILKNGGTESGKQLTTLEGETESDQALQEAQKREREEEQSRLHRAITEDRIRNQ